MSISRRSVLGAGAALGAGALLPAAAPRAATSFTVPRQVLAWYYPWFWTSPDGVTSSHWGFIDAPKQTCTGTLYWPTLAPYTSSDPALITQHFQWMNQAGITGIIVSWWGNNTDPVVTALLSQAATYNISVAFEIPQLLGSTPEQVLTHLVTNFGSDPSILKVQGQPVFFINSPAYSGGGSANWKNSAIATGKATGLTPFLSADVLGPGGYTPTVLANGSVPAVYKYGTHVDFAPKSGVTTLAQIKSKAPGYYAGQVSAVGDAVSSCVVLPRHNGTLVHSGVSNLIVDGYGGQTMTTLLQAATAADPDWIVIVSWNEWGEGSMTEPSLQFGQDSFDPTLTKAFLALTPKTH